VLEPGVGWELQRRTTIIYCLWLASRREIFVNQALPMLSLRPRCDMTFFINSSFGSPAALEPGAGMRNSGSAMGSIVSHQAKIWFDDSFRTHDCGSLVIKRSFNTFLSFAFFYSLPPSSRYHDAHLFRNAADPGGMLGLIPPSPALRVL
jgi:hypothetical protein